MIDKRICEKRFTWNPSKCECEWNKSHDVGEYLNYENWRWKKKLVDKLVKECSENTDEIEIYDGYENVCSSSTIYIAFCHCFFNNHSISSAFIYFHWCLQKVILISLVLILALKQ